MTVPAGNDVLAGGAATIDAELARLEGVLGRISDHDLHRASPGGGWTVAETVSHLNVSALLWVADVERLRRDPELAFFFREEVGHDAKGYPPPSADLALDQVRSTRRSLAHCLPASADVLDRTVEIPDLGTMTVAEWTPLIIGHLQSHVAQAAEILRSRDAQPDGA